MQLTDHLLQKKLISLADYNNATKTQESYGGEIGDILIRLGAIDELTYFKEYAQYINIAILDEKYLPTISQINACLQKFSISLQFAMATEFILFAYEDQYYLASPHPSSVSCLNLMAKLHIKTNLRLITNDVWDQLKIELSNSTQQEVIFDDVSHLREMAEQAPIIDFVNNMFAVALKKRVSDIHIEPFKSFFIIRFRVDGILHEWRKYPQNNFQAITSRIKLLSAMDIAQRRIPQDGRQTIRVSNREIDLRVSSLPSSWGESLVLRLLVKSDTIPALSELGMSQLQSQQFKYLIEKPNGILLITGPTGSGKTTTIYRLIDQLNDGSRKILTIEDPVEYDIKGVMQMQVHEQIGLTFASGLRSILRQDPDVIVIGEIRDTETAKIAVQAALTGHLVISTLHTNSALAAIARLQDLGLESFLIADVLIGLAGQRLGRKLCKSCKTSYTKSQITEINKQLKIKNKGDWYNKIGCKLCNDTGYNGRFSIVEIYDITSNLRAMIRNKNGLDEMQAQMINDGYKTMKEDGIAKAQAGNTTIDEVWRVLGQ